MSAVMDASLIMGVDVPHAAITLNRVALGTFFAISGYLKLFNAARHATLTRTLQDAGVRAVPVMQWVVAGVEFSAGCALIIGLLSVVA
ncbi:MAG: DoxX family membrane protein [Burkholderiales bacterium]